MSKKWSSSSNSSAAAAEAVAVATTATRHATKFTRKGVRATPQKQTSFKSYFNVSWCLCKSSCRAQKFQPPREVAIPPAPPSPLYTRLPPLQQSGAGGLSPSFPLRPLKLLFKQTSHLHIRVRDCVCEWVCQCVWVSVCVAHIYTRPSTHTQMN